MALAMNYATGAGAKLSASASASACACPTSLLLSSSSLRLSLTLKFGQFILDELCVGEKVHKSRQSVTHKPIWANEHCLAFGGDTKHNLVDKVGLSGLAV